MINNIFKNIVISTLLLGNIICNDGTISKSCQFCTRGCCSGHGGCTDNPQNNNSYNDIELTDNYEEDEKTNDNFEPYTIPTKTKENNEDDNDNTGLWVLGLGAGGYVYYKKRKNK